MRILLVDDEEELASALAERLDLRGIPTDWVTSGEQALELVRHHDYDLAVLDVKMPKIGGLELQTRLRVLRPKMAFLFLTGYGSEEDFKQATCQSGEACYLVKPVDIGVLIHRMQEILQGRGGEA